MDEPIIDISLTIRRPSQSHQSSTTPESAAAEAGDEKLQITWSAVDLNQMVPGSFGFVEPTTHASHILKDLQEWALEKYDGALEILTYGAVVGVLEV